MLPSGPSTGLSTMPKEQIAYALHQAEAGTPVDDVCRQLGVSGATLYVKQITPRWTSRRLLQCTDRRHR